MSDCTFSQLSIRYLSHLSKASMDPSGIPLQYYLRIVFAFSLFASKTFIHA